MERGREGRPRRTCSDQRTAPWRGGWENPVRAAETAHQDGTGRCGRRPSRWPPHAHLTASQRSSSSDLQVHECYAFASLRPPRAYPTRAQLRRRGSNQRPIHTIRQQIL